MNFYNISVLNKFNKECKREDVPSFADLDVQYGIEANITGKWKEIIQEKDEKKRKQLIDELVEKMERNKEKNGFFAKDDVVFVGNIYGFKIDDQELYYLFFETLREDCELKKKMDYSIVYKAIKNTLIKYFGKAKANLKPLRIQLIQPTLENEEIVHPSISKQKGLCTGVCVEQASVAHNLWLLCGVKSYYVSTKDMQTDLAIDDDGHSFCIVEYNGSFRVFDSSLEIYKKLDINPIALMKEGAPFVVEVEGKKTTYTNSGKMISITER